MTKTELEVIQRLLGCKSGSIRTRGDGTLRDVYPGRVYDVCRKLEDVGIGRIEKIDQVAFRFSTYDAMHREGTIG